MADSLIPRPYQVQLEEIAVKKNTIIHLPTGSGKTFIAVRLITRFRDALLKPYGQGGKRTFFLVNNVPLVIQQKKVIEQLCPVKNVGGYSSENKVDYWDKEKWDLELSKYQVVVMTSQILADMLTHNYIRIEDINLIIFDECHHAVDDHPMRLVMKNFESCDSSRQPRVLGLTATLINGNVTRNKVEDTLKELETTFHASIATVNELGEVLTYSTNPYEQIIYYQESLPASASKQAILILEQLIQLILATSLPRVASDYNYKLKPWQKDISTDPKKIVKEVKNMVVAMISFIEELGVYGGALSILAYHVLLERLKRKALSKQESTLYSYTITHSLKARKILLESMKNDTGYDKIVKNSSNKICKLLQILKEYNPEVANSSRALKVNRSRKPISAIIFVQQRFTAKILYNLLKDVKEANPVDFGFLKHDFIVGLNINPFKCTREQYFVKKCSEKALLQFCNQDLNCLISTSIIEEGVDIPQCMLVLRYDPPLEYRSYIQSKGRARSAESSYVILISENDLDRWSKLYNNFQIIESYIQKMLTGNTDTREEPSLHEIQKGLYEEDEIPPFVSPSGNRLSSVSAISLLNRYCSVLPHDQFTTISPVWLQEDVVNKHGVKTSIVTIILPIASPVKESITGDPMANLKNAKRSAALKACIKLYEEGELDPDTLLPRQQGVVDFNLTDVKACFPNWHWDSDPDDDIEDLPRAGTKKRVRKHKKVFPTYLNGPKLWKDEHQTFYLHVVKLKVEFKMPTNPREKALFDLLQRDEGYGFLTSQPLPKICDFPMFLAVGEVTASIQMNYAVIKLSKVTFELVKQFHLFLFDQVLDVAKKFLMFDGTVNSMYVVPVKGDGSGDFDIDWNVITTPYTIPPVEPLSSHARRSIHVDPEDYRYSVVTPWYRSPIHPGRYIVSNVLEYMTPKSRFGENSYGTYEDYYSSKYGLDIFGKKDQPLLEVINVSSRMNCLMPRASTLKEELSDKQQKLVAVVQGEDSTRNFNENLVPEFCIKYDYPGVLWYKAIMLPSMVHRITMLLTAYELREQIAKDMKYGDIMLKKGENWSPIVNDRKVVVSSMLAQVEAPSAVNTVDRMNKPLNEDGEPRKLNIVSMKESLYRLLKMRIDKDYPWDEKAEPIDIERNINTVTLMDVECYDAFVEAPIASVATTRVDSIRSPPLAHPSAAILPAPLQYKDKINLLSKAATGRGPELRDVLAALTAANAHDAFNMERAETLGDSFLKFIASLYLYHKFPKLSEGQLTNIKGRLIGNRNLYYAGEKACLGGRMKTEHFSPKKDFLVPGFFAPKQIQDLIEKKQIRPTFLIGMGIPSSEALSGQLSPESWAMVTEKYEESDGSGIEKEPINFIQTGMQCYVRAQAVSDKSVADCVEALVGTYLLSGGMTAAIKVLEWFKVLPPQDNVEHLLRKRVPTPITRRLATVSQIELIMNNYRRDVQEILGYEFKDPSFLLEALSHASYIRNRLTPSYERLEFIGDAILDFLITAYIYENCRELQPGELTDLRSALVNNVTFAAYVVKLGLHKYICSQLNPVLDKAICVFVEHQQQRNHDILEDVLYLIDEQDCQIAEYVEVPKVLSDIFESLVGAMYLDSGGDAAAVWRVVYRVMHREIDAFSKRIPQQPVRVLYEDIHACPSFGTASVTTTAVPRVMVPVTFTKEGRQHTAHGFGGNKFQAKRAAAKLALKILGA